MSNFIELAKHDLKDFQDYGAAREVLGCLIQNPSLLRDYKIDKEDFSDSFHKVIFIAINNLYFEKVTELNEVVIEDYIKRFKNKGYLNYTKNNGNAYVTNCAMVANPDTFEFNYKTLKKYSLLRSCLRNHIDITDIYNPKEIDFQTRQEQREAFLEMSVDDLVARIKRQTFSALDRFTSKGDMDEIKANGADFLKFKESWKKQQGVGPCYASALLTTCTRGMIPGHYNVTSAGTGCGKTRLSVAHICHAFASRYWDDKAGEFVVNPNFVADAGYDRNGNKIPNGALYIGTEMELASEMLPIFASYISNVPEDHIIENTYAEGEEERVDEAAKILDESQIYLVYMPDYSISALESVISRHVEEHQIRAVFFDYIHMTATLAAEYQAHAKSNIALREDQVLANVSLKLKEFARKYNVSIDTATQVNSDYSKNESSYGRDQNAIRGSKAIADKADMGAILSVPTKNELEALKKSAKELADSALGKKLLTQMPNRCVTIYKNRNSKHNKVKIWLYVEYGTMRVHDVFATDADNKPLAGEDKVPPTYCVVSKEGSYVSYHNKKEALTEMEHLGLRKTTVTGTKTIEIAGDDEEPLTDEEVEIVTSMSGTSHLDTISAEQIQKVIADEAGVSYEELTEKTGGIQDVSADEAFEETSKLRKMPTLSLNDNEDEEEPEEDNYTEDEPENAEPDWD